MAVPLLDLRAQYVNIREEIEAVLEDIFVSQHFIGGPYVSGLEADIASYTGIPYAIAVASGTDALLLSLRAAGIGRGDEVILPTFTFFATAGAVFNTGATPVFVDIEPDTFTISPESARQAITSRTRAIVPVHLFGQCADMDAIRAIAEEYDLFIVEDAAQALGAKWNGENACSMGDVGAISFFPSKNLGGAGDGGMILTSREDLDKSLRLQRNHGQGANYEHHIVGTNSRLDALQAAVLQIKLKYLDSWVEARRKNAEYYRQQFAEVEEITLPAEHPRAFHVYNQFTIRIPRRDQVKEHLQSKGIGCAVYYPIPLHLQECFRDQGFPSNKCPIAEQASREVLSLPIYPELTREQQDEVIAEVKSCLLLNT